MIDSTRDSAIRSLNGYFFLFKRRIRQIKFDNESKNKLISIGLKIKRQPFWAALQ
jgi:hypothetical protein